LPRAQQERYVQEYNLNRQGRRGVSAVVRMLESWMHRKVAGIRGVGRTLELGAGTLNHLPYEPMDAQYDVIEPFRFLCASSPHRSRINRFYDDISEVPGGQIYNRILSIAVLEHLTELPWIVARCALLLSPDGAFLAGIPSEGKMLWGLGWRLTTGVAYRMRTGLDYGRIMEYEHINTVDEIVIVTNYFFEKVELSRFPTRWAHLSFYTLIEASRARRDVAARFLAERPYVRSAPPHEM
jgi:hypothetical protein